MSSKPEAKSVQGASGPERRHLTVMFADLVGSTAMSRQLDMEDLRVVNRSYQARATEAIERFGGSVIRYMGDGVLAYFGYPQAFEDDAERAVRAGWALVDAVREISVADLIDVDIQLSCRVGIASGPVVVGDLIGDGAAQELAAVGETPNLAARAEASAEPNTVFVSGNTHRLTQHAIEYESAGLFALKGIGREVELWRAAREQSVGSRFHAARTANLGELVGREGELELLKGRWRGAQSGSGHAIILSGEPGIGKSRLAEALRDIAMSDGQECFVLQCSPYQSNSPFYPFVSHIAQACELSYDQQRDLRALALREYFRNLDFAQDDAEQLADLFGFGADASQRQSPQQKGAATEASLLRYLRTIAAIKPLLLIVEDLQWADASTTEMVEKLVGVMESIPALAILTHRSDYALPWSDTANATVISLSRMGKREAELLAQSVFRQRGMDERMSKTIVDRADGIPLFIEELTQAASEAADVSNQATVPDTLIAALVARIDRSRAARDVAQTASVLGRDFSYRELQTVNQASSAVLNDGFKDLVDARLLQVTGAPPDARCRFRHALIRDAAYSTLTRERRRALHAAAAGLLKQEEQGRNSAENAESLAHHLAESSQLDLAVNVMREATAAAVSRGAYADAYGLLQRTLDYLHGAQTQSMPVSELHVEMGQLARVIFGPGDVRVQAHFEAALELEAPDARTEQKFLSRRALWQLANDAAQYQKALHIADDLLEIAEQAADPNLIVRAELCRGPALLFAGEHCAAHLAFGEALETFRQLDGTNATAVGQGEQITCLLYSAYSDWHAGKHSAAWNTLRRVLEGEERARGPFQRAMALAFASHVAYLDRNYEAVSTYAQECVEVASKAGDLMWRDFAEIHAGFLKARQGLAQGVAQIAEARQRWRERGFEINTHHLWQIMEAEAAGLVGRVDDGLSLIADAEDKMETGEERYVASEVFRVHAQLCGQASADARTSESLLIAAVETAQEIGSLGLELRSTVAYARWLEEKGNAGRLREGLESLISRFNFADPPSSDLDYAISLVKSA
ncbi:MAG: AAA family ATPase [Pseudomonadota bacterium]